MRIFYITSAVKSLSYLDPNIIDGLEQIEQENDAIKVEIFHPTKKSIRKLLTAIKAFNPDVILTLRGGKLNKNQINKIKDLNIPIGIWLVDDPYNIINHIKKAKPFDFVITQESSCVTAYEQAGIKAYHLPLGVNPELYFPMDKVPENYHHDICFVGTGLNNRITFFDKLIPFLKDLDFIIIGRKWERLKCYEEIKSRIINEPIPPTEVVKYYNGSKIILNIHRAIDDINRNPDLLPAKTPNNRTFDIAACRAFQLIDYREELGDLFKLGEEIVTHHDLAELKEQIMFYIENETLREEIANKSYVRTIAEHTYHTRLKDLITIIDEKIVSGK